MEAITEVLPQPSKEQQLEIDAAYTEYLTNDGVLTLETTERLRKSEAAEISSALTSYGNLYQYLDAKYEAKRAELEPLIERLASEIKFFEQKRDFVKWRIKQILTPGLESGITNERVDMFYSPSESLEIIAPSAVPIEYCRVVEPQPDTKAIKEALKAGLECDWARINTSYNLQIKPGGERAIANSIKRKKDRAKKQQPAAQPGAEYSVEDLI